VVVPNNEYVLISLYIYKWVVKKLQNQHIQHTVPSCKKKWKKSRSSNAL